MGGNFTKKYSWKKRDKIGGTSFEYIAEAGYKGKHRMILLHCTRCSTIKTFRLDHVMAKRTTTCGCHREELIESGKLAQYSISARKKNKLLQKGGRGYLDGYFIRITPKQAEMLTTENIQEIVDFIKEKG